jgi:SAM-dependent methyltransferase
MQQIHAAPPDLTQAQQHAGKYWDSIATAAITPRTAWWNDPVALRHVNRLVCGEPLPEQHDGFHRRLAQRLLAQNARGGKAISVGAGTGSKEIRLLKSGMVGSFVCFEAGAEAIAVGESMAIEHGVAGRIAYHRADALTAMLPADFDLVYWNSALHHMPDTNAALRWSRERLRDGGVLACDEYVGATRFQHSDAVMAWCNRLLALLPDRLLRRPDQQSLIPRNIGRIKPEELIAIDPTEACDSANILPGIAQHFPGAEIVPTGGALYFIGLNEAFHNFVNEEDIRLLNGLLDIDAAIGRMEETQYAVIFAIKTAPPAPQAPPPFGRRVLRRLRREWRLPFS